jgi:hypothetical protein
METRLTGITRRRGFDTVQTGLPALLARLRRSALIDRARFLISAAYLLPLTAAFLLLAVAALAFRANKRRGYRPFLLGVIAGLAVLLGKFAWECMFTMYGALGLLFVASLWNAWPIREAASWPECQIAEI